MITDVEHLGTRQDFRKENDYRSCYDLQLKQLG